MRIIIPLETGHPVIDSNLFEVVIDNGMVIATRFIEISSRGDAAAISDAGGESPDTAADWIIHGFEKWYAGCAQPWCDAPIAYPGSSTAGAAVHDALLATQRGELISYAALARRALGTAKAARAAGTLCARNPLPLLVPCHRVVPCAVTQHIAFTQHTGSGSIPPNYGNYAYGRELKKALIEYESAIKD